MLNAATGATIWGPMDYTSGAALHGEATDITFPDATNDATQAHINLSGHGSAPTEKQLSGRLTKVNA